MYGLNSEFYKAGFWSYFTFDIILSDTFGVIIYSLPAIFLKFSRVFAKNLIEKKQLEMKGLTYCPKGCQANIRSPFGKMVNKIKIFLSLIK